MVGVLSFALYRGHWKFIKIVKSVIVKLKKWIWPGFTRSARPRLIINLILTSFVLSICNPRTILKDPTVAPCMQNCLLSVGSILVAFEACAVKTKLIYTFQCIIFVHKQGLILKEKVDIHGKKCTQISIAAKKIVTQRCPKIIIMESKFFIFHFVMFILTY